MPGNEINLALLSHVAHGQTQRTVRGGTKSQYAGKVKIMTKILNSDEQLRVKALETVQTVNGPVAKKHTGTAKNIYKLKLPITTEVAQLLFAAISIDDSLPKKRKRTYEENDVGEILEACDNQYDEADDLLSEEVDPRNPAKNKHTVTGQTYQNYKSALKFWHQHDDPDMDKVGYPWPPDVDFVLHQSIASYKRDVGIKKRMGFMPQKEGKSKYSLHGFKVICDYFASILPVAGIGNRGHTVTWNAGLFAGLFTKLSVSTIGRSDNIDDLLLNYIDWENDAMTVVFVTTKSDQAGERTSEKKRIYANRFNPSICTILSLAVYTWCKRRTSDNNKKLFDGDEQNKRYYQILMNAMKEIPASIDLGCNRDDIGTHSNRKFAESTTVSRVDGPNRTQVCLRAGQSVGRTQDCYMSQEDDGDAFVGRTVAQLKFDADEFDSLPCHFAPETLIIIQEYGWDLIIDGYSHYPESFKRVISILFPTLIHHYFNGDLAKLYPEGHPIFAQRIFTNQSLISSLKEKIILKHGACSESGMWAEGVPAVIMVSREIRQLQSLVTQQVSLINRKIEDMDGKFDDVNSLINNRIDS